MLSIVLSGIMLMTSFGAGTVALAAGPTDDAEYKKHIATAVGIARKQPFEGALYEYKKVASSYTATLYDSKDKDIEVYVATQLTAAKRLYALNRSTYRDYKKTMKQVADDIKKGLGDDLTPRKESVITNLGTANNFNINPYFFGEAATAEELLDQYSFSFIRYTMNTTGTSWSRYNPSTGSGSDKNLKKFLIAFRDADFSHVLNLDTSTADFAELSQAYRDGVGSSAYKNLAKYPSWLYLDVTLKFTQFGDKLAEIALAVSEEYLKAAEGFQKKYSSPSKITVENYEAAKADFADLSAVKGSVLSDIKNDIKTQADKIYAEYSGSDAIKNAIADIISEKADGVSESYGENGEKVTAANVTEAQSAISAVNAIFNDETFGSVTSHEACKQAVAKLAPVQTAVDFITGDGAGFIEGVSDLKEQYGGENFTVPVEEAEKVHARLTALKAKYDAMTAGAKADARIQAAFADYEKMAAAVVNPYFEDTKLDYEAAVSDAKDAWFEGDAPKALTIQSYADVRATLAKLKGIYGRFATQEQRDNAEVATLKAVEDALRAAYDAAMISGAYTPSEFTYPDGLNADSVAEAVNVLDTVLTNPMFVSMLADALGVSVSDGTDLKGLVQAFIENNLYTDATVTAVVQMIYPALEGMLGADAGQASMVGILVYPDEVAKEISDDYPNAKAALRAAGKSWASVDWTAVTWGVSDEESFYRAMGQGLNGLNALLNVVLNNIDSGGSLAGLNGIEGYRLTVIPLLETLGCKNIMTPAEFKKDTSTQAIIQNLLTMILERVYEICEAPASNIASLLPQLAYFINSDGLKQILSPLSITGKGQASGLVDINIWDTLSATTDLSDLNALLGNLVAGLLPGLQWVDINFGYLAGLGTGEATTNAAGDRFTRVTADQSKVIGALLRYAGKVLNVNADLVKGLLPPIEDAELAEVVSGYLDQLLKTKPEIFAREIVHFLVPDGAFATSPYNYPEIAKGEFAYPEGVRFGEAAYAMAPAAIDELLKGLVNLPDTVKGALYTNETIQSVLQLYDTIEADPALMKLLKAIGINTDFAAVKAAALAIQVTDSASFVKALTTALQPFDDILALVLAGEDYNLFGYRVQANDAYNTVVIPLLEAFGCTDVMSYAEYQAAVKGGASPLAAILTQVLNRLDEILASPVDSLTKLLPNLAYFLDSHNLSVMLQNLIAPLDTLLKHVEIDSISAVSDVLEALDLPAVNELDNDLAGLLNLLLGTLNVNGKPLGIVLPDMNLHAFASYGTAQEYTSAMKINEFSVGATRIVADQADVTGAIIGYLYQMLSIETNKNAMVGLLGDDGALVGGILSSLIASGEAGFTNALFEILGLPANENGSNGGNNGGDGNQGGDNNGGNHGDNGFVDVETGDTAFTAVLSVTVLAAGAALVLGRKKKAYGRN